MSHEGNAQFPSGSSPPPQQFSSTASGFNKNNVPLTTLERWAIGRSDTSFRVVAGAAAGIMSGVVTCPLDVIKTKLQAQGGFRNQSNSPQNVVYRGLIGTGRVIWREEGLRGMYRGLGPIILGYLPTWAVWFTVYGRSKEYFEKSNGMLLWMCIENFANHSLRQSNAYKLLLFNCGGCFLNHGHKSNLGYQDSSDVTSQQQSFFSRKSASVALPIDYGRFQEDV